MDRETADAIKRHFDVVAEGLRSEIRLLAEGVGANADRIDRLDETINRAQTRLDRFATSVAAEFKSVHQEFGSLRVGLERLEARFAS